MSEQEPLVVVRELHKSFLHMDNELEVLKGIDLEIGQGEVLAIVGKSGAGKSTLLQCIGTLDLPSSGVIRLGKHYLVGMGSAALALIRNQTIGFVFQFHHLLPEFNALENVMMPGLIRGMPRSEVETWARALLEDMGLGHRVTHRPGELSGGEQQRVALARALVLKPKLILADEPTGNLDTATSDSIHKLFFDINKKHGTTIIVVTHNLKLAESMPRVVRMLDGKIIEDNGRADNNFQIDEKVLERSRAIAKVKYAGFWRRTAARVFDSVTMWFIAALVGWLVGSLGGAALGEPAQVMSRLLDWKWIAGAWLVGATMQLLYHSIAEHIGGATFAKMIFGLRVRDESLNNAKFGAALVRNIVVYIDGLLFGLVAYIGMNGSLLKQRFGDGLAQTVVVHAKSLPDEDVGGSIAGAALGVVVYAMFMAAYVFVWLTV
jgi:lipoprotein-releasing system ATP-binding protein